MRRKGLGDKCISREETHYFDVFMGLISQEKYKTTVRHSKTIYPNLILFRLNCILYMYKTLLPHWNTEICLCVVILTSCGHICASE